jgi:hypothetical protein
MKSCALWAAALAVSLLPALWVLAPPPAPAAGVTGIAAGRLQSLARKGNTMLEKPATVTALEAAYGAPSQAGFGSAVFYAPLPATADLDAAARIQYRYFVGELWERYGEAA